jgi:3-hydroxyacyl-[acyl-carrier-protein] dehydratase
MSENSLNAIHAAIPHRPPMLLVDEVVLQEPDHIVCRKRFSEYDFFVQGHFPGFPLVPGVILCECALQTGAILIAAIVNIPSGQLPIATRLDGVKFKRMVRPGDTIEIDVKLNEVVSSAYFMTGKISVEGKLAARLDFACSSAAPSS